MRNHSGQILCMPSGRQRAGAGIFHLILPGCFWGIFGSLCQTPCRAQHYAEIKTQPVWCVVLVAHTGTAWLWKCRQSRQRKCTEPLAALQDGWQSPSAASALWHTCPPCGCHPWDASKLNGFAGLLLEIWPRMNSAPEQSALSNHLTCPQTANTQGRFCQMLNILCFSSHPLSWGSSLLKVCSSWITYSMGPACSVHLTKKHTGLACCIAAQKSLTWRLLTAGLGQYHCSFGCHAAVWTGPFDQTPYL